MITRYASRRSCIFAFFFLTYMQIFNDFAGLGNDTHPFTNASDAYTIFNSQSNYDPVHSGEHYYEFQYGDVVFFGALLKD